MAGNGKDLDLYQRHVTYVTASLCLESCMIGNIRIDYDSSFELDDDLV